MVNPNRRTTQEKNSAELIEELSCMFVPVVARCCSFRRAQNDLNKSLFGMSCDAESQHLPLSDLPESDVNKYEHRCNALVLAWLRMITDRYHGCGLPCGMLDNRMFPRNTSDEEVTELFAFLGFNIEGSYAADVKLINSVFLYFKRLYCPHRDLPKQMVRLLELHHVTLDELI